MPIWCAMGNRCLDCLGGCVGYERRRAEMAEARADFQRRFSESAEGKALTAEFYSLFKGRLTAREVMGDMSDMSTPTDDADVRLCIAYALQQTGALKRRDRMDEPHHQVAERVLAHLKLSGFAVVRVSEVPLVTPSSTPAPSRPPPPPNTGSAKGDPSSAA